MRDAEDFSALPDAETSAPGFRGGEEGSDRGCEELLDLADFAPDIPVYAEALGGPAFAAAEAEADLELPEEFLALTPQSRMACRLRAGGMKVKAIADLMRYSAGSVSTMLNRPLAKSYIAWLQARMDGHVEVVSNAMQLLGIKATERLTDIIHNSENENLVARCTFQLFDRIGLKPAERVVIENSNSITSADIAALKKADTELSHVLEQSGEA